MKYVLTEIEDAVKYGFVTNHHRANAKYVLLNEKEITDNATLTGDFAERCETLNAKVLSRNEAYLATSKKGEYLL